MNDARHALEQIAQELGVKPNTLAQYAEAAGSYSIRNSHSTPHRRKLPPRGSPDGILLAQRIRDAVGTDQVRTLAPK
jgi:hypothetical protein